MSVAINRSPLGVAGALLEELRLHQWVKNLLVFISPLAAQVLFTEAVFGPACLLFFGFCLAASGVYIINDLFDLQADRAHPRKSRRPFASGRLPIHFGILGPVLIGAGVAAAFTVSAPAALVMIGYVIISLSYSYWLKTQPLVDVFVLSGLYTIRVYAGEVAFDIEPSIWLLSFSGFLFLSLAFLKRVAEYVAMQRSEVQYDTRRGYRSSDIEILKMLGVSSSYVATMVLGLYLNSANAETLYSSPVALWGAIPIFLFWQSRMWLAAARGKMTDDPIVYAAQDWPSRACLLLLVAIYGFASFT